MKRVEHIWLFLYAVLLPLVAAAYGFISGWILSWVSPDLFSWVGLTPGEVGLSVGFVSGLIRLGDYK